MSQQSKHAALDALANALGVNLTAEQRAELVTFIELVERWNARIDLTAARGDEQLAEVLCADALVLSDTALVPRNARVADIGTGCGAPALPFLLLRPDVRAVLIEPLKKRTSFLRTVVGSVPSLTGRVDVRDGRIDVAAPRVDGMPFDVAMSRATFSPQEWLRAGSALALDTVVFVARDEEGLNQKPRASKQYTLPRTGAHRDIRVYRLL